MSIIYLETSAVLTWLLGEPRAGEVIAKINEAKTIVSSVLTLLETERALIRAERQKLLSSGDRQRLKGLLAKAKTGWIFMELSEEVRSRAAQPFPVEPVRTLDAIHLSTAAIFLRAYPGLKVLSCDQRIMSNVQALGIG